jgi:Holliday junction resolvase RusA-like endonuclease
MTLFSCVILGKPVGWKAPQFDPRTGRAYPNAEYDSWKNAATWVIRAEARGQKIKTPCKITITIYIAHRGNDGTNILKACEDALVKAQVVKDDSLLHVPVAERRFGGVDKKNPRVEILVETI